ncbi:site-specific integrase [Vibrio vulnificus]
MTTALAKQAERLLKKQIAFGRSRRDAKRRDNTSAGLYSVRHFYEMVGALAHAAETIGVERLHHISETHAVIYLITRQRLGLSGKTLSRDRNALQRLLHKRLPQAHELHRLSRVPSFTDNWLQQQLHQRKHTAAVQKLVQSAWDAAKEKIDLNKDSVQFLSPSRTSKTRPGDSRPLKSISRIYTNQQVMQIGLSFSNERTRLAVFLARDAGLRVSELITLRRVGEGEGVSNQRDWRADRHLFRPDSVEYLVTGKGGLVRTVRISKPLAERLEALRLDSPEKVFDRKTSYTRYYDLTAGNHLSKAFTNASMKTIGRSYGAHGLRHSYAQSRLQLLMSKGYNRYAAMHIVSQEMGHMRMQITKVYMR